MHRKEAKVGINVPTVFDVEPNETRPMTREESNAFVTLSLSAHQKPSAIVKGKDLDAAFREQFKVPEGSPLPFQIAVGVKRLEVCDPEGEFDTDMVMFAFGALSDRVGNVVLWAHGLSKGRVRNNGQAITLAVWAEQLHPMGVPTTEAMARIWDAQKCHVLGVKGDNYLDLQEAWT